MSNSTITKNVKKAAGALFCAAFLGAAPTTTVAQTVALKNFEATKSAVFTPVYGKALSPIGYVNFCALNSNECKNLGGTTRQVVLTEKNWKVLHEVNKYVNKTVAPITDQDLYDVPEFWTYPTGAGDCEDYVLQKKRYLEGLGFPAEILLITVVLDENGGGHAVLTVRTDRGDIALDNRRDDIRTWDKTGYTYIKRQAQSNPNQWVSLTNRGISVALTTAAGKD